MADVNLAQLRQEGVERAMAIFQVPHSHKFRLGEAAREVSPGSTPDACRSDRDAAIDRGT
jgi:hypothetical protein